MRYLLQKRAGAAVIGSICIVLTIIATAVTLLVAQKMYVNLQKQIDQQMQYYNELGI